jgi:MFS family permease
VVITLPTIGSQLHIPESRQQWLVSSYSLTFGCFMLLWGRLADVYGRRLIFIWGSAWVTATTIAIPFAKNEIAINALRGLQGLVSRRIRQLAKADANSCRAELQTFRPLWEYSASRFRLGRPRTTHSRSMALGHRWVLCSEICW